MGGDSFSSASASISGLLGSALSSEADVTSNPESKQAEELIDERFPDRDALDELVIVRSEELTGRIPAFRERVESLADELAGSDGVEDGVELPRRGGETC